MNINLDRSRPGICLAKKVISGSVSNQVVGQSSLAQLTAYVSIKFSFLFQGSPLSIGQISIELLLLLEIMRYRYSVSISLHHTQHTLTGQVTTIIPELSPLCTVWMKLKVIADEALRDYLFPAWGCWSVRHLPARSMTWPASTPGLSSVRGILSSSQSKYLPTLSIWGLVCPPGPVTRLEGGGVCCDDV